MAKGSDKVAFLGPEGTFTEEALLANMPDGGLHPFPYPSIPDVLRAVQAGEAPLGIVAIENALEGSVPVTMDSLVLGFDDLHIVREVTHPVHQMLDHQQRDAARPDHQGHQHPARLRAVPRLHPRAPRQRGARGDRLDGRGRPPREPRQPAVGGRRHAARRRDVRVPHRRRGHRGRRGQRHALRVRGEAAGAPGPRRARTRPASSAASTRTSRAASCSSSASSPTATSTSPRSSPGRPSARWGTTSSSSTWRAASTSQPVALALKCLACKLPWIKVLGSYPT